MPFKMNCKILQPGKKKLEIKVGSGSPRIKQ